MGRLLEPGGDIGTRSMIEAAPPDRYRDGSVQNPAYRFAAANRPLFVQTEGGFCWLMVHGKKAIALRHPALKLKYHPSCHEL